MWMLLLACSKCAEEAPPPVPAEPLWVEPSPPASLLLAAHADAEPSARVGAVVLADGQHRGLGEVPTLPVASWLHPDEVAYYTLIAAADNDGFLAATLDGEGYALLHRRLDGSERQIPVGTRRPASLMMLPDRVLIGAENTVGHLDLRASEPSVEVVLTQEEMFGKAFDLFSRDGDWLIAVDDVVMPFYADLFRLTADGIPTHLTGLTLPGVVNGSYDLVHLSRTGPDAGVLFAVTRFGSESGSGHKLSALSIVDNLLAMADEELMRRSGGLYEAITELASPTDEGDLWAGAEYTPLSGLERLGDQLLLAAGSRGLMIVTAKFSSRSSASIIDVGGNALDVEVVGPRAWVLVELEGGSLLQAVEADLSLGVRHSLPEVYTQIID